MTTVAEFNALDQDGQIACLQTLGQAALEQYGVQPTKISPLVHAENTTFFVEAPQGRFNLRINRPGYQSTANIQSEIVWLSALRAAGFGVPAPFQGRLVTAQVDEVPEPRDCVLFRWLNGEFRTDTLSSDEAALIGNTMARLHEFSRRWVPPPEFDRQQTHAWAFQDQPSVGIGSPSSQVSEEDRAVLLRVDAQSRRMLRSYPKTAETFGLIHADLHVGNLLFEDGHLNIIDFDDTGWAFLLYDFAATLAFQVSRPNYREVRAALLEGYAQVRPLPPGTEELLDPFIRMRLTGVCGWMIDRADNPGLRAMCRNWVHEQCGWIETLRPFSSLPAAV
jgi:Ser/Thr protein kinase RdoA (MazF antagonist)